MPDIRLHRDDRDRKLSRPGSLVAAPGHRRRREESVLSDLDRSGEGPGDRGEAAVPLLCSHRRPPERQDGGSSHVLAQTDRRDAVIGNCEVIGMNALTAFGLFAVSAMLVCYALERRSRWYVLGFAGAC